MTTHRLALPELAPGQSTILEIEGQRILLCRSAAGLHAMSDICPHQDKSLEGGRIRQGTLMCPHHGARFNLADGQSLSPPLTTNGLKLFACRSSEGLLVLDL